MIQLVLPVEKNKFYVGSHCLKIFFLKTAFKKGIDSKLKLLIKQRISAADIILAITIIKN
jgi:hypothetical protein